MDPLPERFSSHERNELRYLRGFDWKFKKTYQTITWLEERGIPQFDEVKHQKYFDLGAIYISGRLTKHGYEPVFNIDLKKLRGIDMMVVEEILVIYLSWMIEHMMVPGRVETFFLVIDCSNLSAHEFPVKKLKSLTGVTKNYFISRTYDMLLVNASWLLRSIFRIVQLW